MSEKLAELKKKGGKDPEPVMSTITANKSINGNYLYLATGYFLGCTLTRGGVTTAPTVQIYVKKSDNTYAAVSNAVTTQQETYAYLRATALEYGDLYIKKTGGSDFTTSSFNFAYFTI